MRKIILYIASSLNGYIAKADGSVEWLENIPNPDNENYDYNKLLNTIDTTIQGNGTYNQIVEWGIEFPYKGNKNYVITRNESAVDNENVTFITNNHVEFIRQLKRDEGRDIWLIGGGKVNSLMLNNGLIDEVHQYLMPIIIEDGIKLFDSVNENIDLNIIDTKIYESNVIRYRYKVVLS